MDKLKNIISPGHEKDDELLYGHTKHAGNTGTITGEGTHLATSREQTVRHKPSDSGYAFSGPGETPQNDLPGAFPYSEQPTPVYETGAAEPQSYQSYSADVNPEREPPMAATTTTATTDAAYEPVRDPQLQQQAAVGAAAPRGTDPFVASNRLQVDSPNDDTSTASIKSGIVGRTPSQRLTDTASPSDYPPGRLTESTAPEAVGTTAAATAAPTAAVIAETHAEREADPITSTTTGPAAGTTAVMPASTAPREQMDTSKNGFLHQSSTYTARSFPLRGSPGNSIQNLDRSEVTPSAPATATYDAAAPGSQAGVAMSQPQEHHYGRDAATAGATAVGAGAAYEGLHDSERGTGPASRTVGPHESNAANVLDPRVLPQPDQQKSSEVKNPETGPATKTVGPHKSNTANVLDPRVLPQPENQKSQEVKHPETGPASRTFGPHKSNILNILDPRVRPDPKKMKHRDAKDADTGATSQTVDSAEAQAEERHHGHDAAVAGGAALAGAGAAEAWKDHKDKAVAIEPYTHPYSTKPLDPRVDRTSQTATHGPTTAPAAAAASSAAAAAPAPVTQEQQQQQHHHHHYGRDAAVSGAGAAFGVDVYDAAEHGNRSQQATRDPTLVGTRSTYEDQRAEPTRGTQMGHHIDPQTLLLEKEQAQKQDMPQTDEGLSTEPTTHGTTATQPEEHSHFARDAAIGAGAAGAGLTAAEEYEHHRRNAEEAEAAMREQTAAEQYERHRRNAEEAEAAMWGQHRLQKKQDERDLKTQAREQEKEARKAEKQHQKELERQQREHDKEMRREAKRADKEYELEAKKQEKEIKRIEKEQDKAARQLDKEQAIEIKRAEKEQAKEEKQHEKKGSLFGFLHRDKDKHGDERVGEEREEIEHKRRHSDVPVAAGAGAAAAGAYEYEQYKKEERGPVSRGTQSRDSKLSKDGSEHAEKPRRRASVLGALFRRKDKSGRRSPGEVSDTEQPSSPTKALSSGAASTHSNGAGKHRNKLHKEMPERYAQHYAQKHQQLNDDATGTTNAGEFGAVDPADEQRRFTATHSGLPNDGERPLQGAERGMGDSLLPMQGYNEAQPEMSFREPHM